MAGRSVVRENAAKDGMSEREYVTQLIEAHGSVADAAIAIGLRPASMYYWMSRLGLEVVSSTHVVRSAVVVAKERAS